MEVLKVGRVTVSVVVDNVNITKMGFSWTFVRITFMSWGQIVSLCAESFMNVAFIWFTISKWLVSWYQW